MTPLIERQEAVLFRQARQDVVPHPRVRHQRVDKDEPRRISLVPFGQFDVDLDSAFDFDVMFRFVRLWERNGGAVHVADIERDEQPRDHVVCGCRGSDFEKLLIVFEVRFQLVDHFLGHGDREGRGVCEPEGSSLQCRQRRRRVDCWQRCVKIANYGQLLGGETSVRSDVSMV